MRGIILIMICLLLFAGGALFGIKQSHPVESGPVIEVVEEKEAGSCSDPVKSDDPFIAEVAVGVGEGVSRSFDVFLMLLYGFAKG
ncbi:hypothetical protein [Halobacillus sp. Marseille-Q1614]|uniref:hypothetical protein n=1 Tax=Halobacillus sp. Marseille-Q1614 TaxID=2709134 RepID=UPI001570948C|nr:hypothetical protein [Halobacillus sp. Marseille-Q1614]